MFLLNFICYNKVRGGTLSKIFIFYCVLILVFIFFSIIFLIAYIKGNHEKQAKFYQHTINYQSELEKYYKMKSLQNRILLKKQLYLLWLNFLVKIKGK